MRGRELKIAYIGGGSRAWARKLMGDLASADNIYGEVRLYDIDGAAARDNEIIGNRTAELGKDGKRWNYRAVDDINNALIGCDAVIISVIPALLTKWPATLTYRFPTVFISRSETRWEPEDICAQCGAYLFSDILRLLYEKIARRPG